MANIDASIFKDWNNGETMYEADYEKDREIIRTAINDNYARLIKKFEVLLPDGTLESTLNLDTAINYLKFKETSTIALVMDTTNATLTMSVIDGSITSAKLANLGVTTGKLADLSVTTGKIADGAINLTKIDTTSLDTRYYTQATLDNGVLDTRYYTETELDGGQLDTRYYTEAEVDKLLSDTSGGMALSVKNDTNFPSTHNEADVLYRTDTDKFYISNGSVWQEYAKQADLNTHKTDSNAHKTQFRNQQIISMWGGY